MTPQQKIQELEQFIAMQKLEFRRNLKMESYNLLTQNILNAERLIYEYYKLTLTNP